MKYSSIYILMILTLGFGLSSCQPDEVAPMQPGGQVSEPVWELPPPPPFVPTEEVTRIVYPEATTWRLTFDNPTLEYLLIYQKFFSTVDGSTWRLQGLRDNSMAISLIDFRIAGGKIISTKNYIHALDSSRLVRSTQLKPSNLGPLQLGAMKLNPSQFEEAFESSGILPTYTQPFIRNVDPNVKSHYKKGDIYLFKTDRTPARYGAIQIIEGYSYLGDTDKSIIEITVQADNYIVELDN